MNRNPIVEDLESRLDDLIKFRTYLGKNSDRNLEKLTLNFRHPRFHDNTGFALLNLTTTSDSNTLAGIIDAGIESMISDLQQQLKQLRQIG